MTMGERSGIKTEYKGHIFRSTLEAQWAAFFDFLKWPWTYEPFELAGYIPDFVLPFQNGNVPLLVEVKPEFGLEQLYQYTDKISQSGWKGNALVVGCLLFHDDDKNKTLGIINETFPGAPEEPSGDFGPAAFGICEGDNGYGLAHPWQSFHCRVCGHYDGHQPIAFNEMESARLDGYWAEAHNLTRWNLYENGPQLIREKFERTKRDISGRVIRPEGMR